MVQIGQNYEVDSYFKMHRGCHVTLYQDVKVPLGMPAFEMIRGPNDRRPDPKSCWFDLYHSINQVFEYQKMLNALDVNFTDNLN